MWPDIASVFPKKGLFAYKPIDAHNCSLCGHVLKDKTL